MECLEAMEQRVVHVWLLSSTGLHFIIRALGSLSSDQFIPVNNDIPECALMLVDRWKPLFLKDTENRHWTHRGLKKLIYVPLDDDALSYSIFQRKVRVK